MVARWDADLSEVWRLAGMSQSTQSTACCPRCLCPSSQLHASEPFPKRDLEATNTLIKEKAKEELSHQGLIMVENPMLKGVFGMFNVFTDTCFDDLHVFDQGINRNLYDAVLENLSTEQKQILDERFQNVETHPKLASTQKGIVAAGEMRTGNFVWTVCMVRQKKKKGRKKKKKQRKRKKQRKKQFRNSYIALKKKNFFCLHFIRII